MARDSKEQRAIKIKALKEAIEMLKESSTTTSNLVTSEKVVNMANELYFDKLDTKISLTTIKSPTTAEFVKIKEVISEYREEYRKIKSIIPNTAIKETSKLKNQIKELVSEVVKFYDYKLLLNEKLEAKENTIEKLKTERDRLYEEINILRKN